MTQPNLFVGSGSTVTPVNVHHIPEDIREVSASELQDVLSLLEASIEDALDCYLRVPVRWGHFTEVASAVLSPQVADALASAWGAKNYKDVFDAVEVAAYALYRRRQPSEAVIEVHPHHIRLIELI